VILAGAFGGIAPNVIGGAQQLLRRTPDASGHYLLVDPWFLFGTLVVGVISGTFLFFAHERNALKAMALGAAAPAVILGWAQGIPSNPSPSGNALVPTVAESTAVKQSTEWTRPLILPARDGGPVLVDLRGLQESGLAGLDFVAVLRGDPASTAPVRAELRYRLPARDTTVQVPAQAIRAYVQLGNETSNFIELPADSPLLRLRVALQRPPASAGFARAFGVRSAPLRHLLLTRLR
jgi:hypothetical protein